MYETDVLRGFIIISVAIASSEAKGNPGAVASAAIGSRREIRRQLAASSGKKEGHSAVGMKRKDRGSLEIAGTCCLSVVIPPFNVTLLSFLSGATRKAFHSSKRIS